MAEHIRTCLILTIQSDTSVTRQGVNRQQQAATDTGSFKGVKGRKDRGTLRADRPRCLGKHQPRESKAGRNACQAGTSSQPSLQHWSIPARGH